MPGAQHTGVTGSAAPIPEYAWGRMKDCRYKSKVTQSGSPRLWPCRKMVTSANPEGWWSARYARYEVASRPAEQIL